MMDHLSGNPAALEFAEGLWRFFGCRLLCSMPSEEETSRVRYGITGPYVPEVAATAITPSIQLARTDRMTEALVHELLHLELLRRGYPRFYFDNKGNHDSGLALGIQNSSDHVAMLPRFIELGYTADRFLTQRDLTVEDLRRVREIESLPDLHNPAGYAKSVSNYLRTEGFSFRLVYVR